jgi:hypothetical protein
MRLFRKRATNRGRAVATAARKQPIAGAHARSSQKRLTFDQTEPLITISTIGGTAAASAETPQGHDRMRSPAVTIPAASIPTANSTARSGVNLTNAVFMSGTWGPSTPMITTMAATRPTIARALTRRTSSNNTGSRT